MQKLTKFWSYLFLAITCLASNVGIVNAGPIKFPETRMSTASDPVYLQSNNVTAFSSQMTSAAIQKLYPNSHYSHGSHNSHYSHRSHYSSYQY